MDDDLLVDRKAVVALTNHKPVITIHINQIISVLKSINHIILIINNL